MIATIRKCCKIECDADAEYEIRSGPRPDDSTDSCSTHIGELLDDSRCFTVARIQCEGEKDGVE